MRQSLLDLVVLLCLAQVVVWPLRLLTAWPPLRSAAIDLTIGGWALTAAALVALGTLPYARRPHLLRLATMVAAVLVVGAVPLGLLLAGGPLPFASDGALAAADQSWWRLAALSPISGLHAVANGSPTIPSDVEWQTAVAGWVFACAAWIAVAFLRGPLQRQEPDATPDASPDRWQGGERTDR